MEMEWTRGKCIGKGAFGTVHLAVHRATGRAFAVKSVDAKGGAPAAAAMACLETEIRILRRLCSPYVVAYLGDDATAASRNLHMELVSGGCAADAGGLGERAARRVLRRVAAALHYLHDVAGVVHGDVKGRNVLVGGGGAGYGGSKLADFGAARLVSEPAPRGPRGTPAWMAPEVARGGASTPPSDVWSLGCTAVELLTGKRPWSEIGGALEVGELLLHIGYGGKRPELPARLSEACNDFLDKCLRRDAGERWSCEQLLRHPFLTADPHDAGEPSPSPRAVLDWAAASDSDTDASSDCHPEADIEDEVIIMASAKARIAELASDTPRPGWVRELEEGPTWASDTWAPPPNLETSTDALPLAPPVPSPSDTATVAGAGNGGAASRDGVIVTGRSGGGGSCRVQCRSWCDDRRGCHKCGSGFDRPSWPPLAVAPVPVSCTLLRLNQSINLFQEAANELMFLLQLLVVRFFTAQILVHVSGWF
ncbi:hypothetical protein ZWY2020_034308 [Hordeum vulgare]|nr:hypothetical protein ZWY2020_034308 [Hordeum vulgare]